MNSIKDLSFTDYMVDLRNKIERIQTSKCPIKPEWKDYYNFLYAIHRIGKCNMLYTAPLLAEAANLSESLADEILLSWCVNQDEIQEMYSWQ